MQLIANPPGDEFRLLSVRQVAELFDAGQSTILEWVRKGRYEFPKPIKVGRLTRWRSDELQAWIEARQRAK